MTRTTSDSNEMYTCSTVVYLLRLVIALLGISLGACAPHKSSPRAQMGDSIRFEAGAEVQARQLADSLPETMSGIERGHQYPFKQQPMIFLFTTDEKFEQATGYHADRVAGLSIPSGVYLSPEGTEPWNAILAHELSHVLLRQWVGDFRFHRIPIWFREGLATWVSAGGGAGSVSNDQARLAIHDGETFDPNLNEGLLFRKDAVYWGIPYPMFYRQSALFIDFLAATHPESWDRLLTEVHQGTRFSEAFGVAFEDDKREIWSAFISGITGPDLGQ